MVDAFDFTPSLLPLMSMFLGEQFSTFDKPRPLVEIIQAVFYIPLSHNEIEVGFSFLKIFFSLLRYDRMSKTTCFKLGATLRK